MAKKKKSKSKKGKAIPTNPALYARVKAKAKKKFKVYPSAYANGWLVRTYKKRGGGYRSG
jgi:hypothetical protein